VGPDAYELTELRRKLAWSLYGLGRYWEAAVEFERIVRARPDWAGPHSALGWSYLKLGRKADARAAFQRALSLAPGSADAVEGLARASR
jgi:Flp pilus assembly protein TadD